jgi:hypothetical protein
MFREQISEISEARRPAPKPTPWLPIVLIAVVGLGVAHVAGLTEPLKSMALQLTGGGSRAPGSRLIGDWESDNDPMCQRLCFPVLKNPEYKNGMIFMHNGSRQGGIIYAIASEDGPGRNLELAEFLPGVKLNYRARYAIAPDGKSLTREYDAPNGTHIVCQYRYVGPPTETLAQ